MCQRGFLQKDEHQGWDLFEDLAEKIIQWEPTPEKSRNTNLISSKGGLHYIESSIAAKARIANLARILELLETKEPVPVNQVSPHQILNPGCTTIKPQTICLKNVLFFMLNKCCPSPWMAVFSRPHNNPYAQTYNSGWKNHSNLLLSQNNYDHSRSNHSNHFQPPNFPLSTQFSQPSFITFFLRSPCWQENDEYGMEYRKFDQVTNLFHAEPRTVVE